VFYIVFFSTLFFPIEIVLSGADGRQKNRIKNRERALEKVWFFKGGGEELRKEKNPKM
jgi:hypothetical protein